MLFTESQVVVEFQVDEHGTPGLLKINDVNIINES